jgi:hypothetical protein
MKRLFWVAVVWVVVALAGVAMAKDKDPTGNIKDDEAVKCIGQRLEEQTGARGWKIQLKDLAGSSRDFIATLGQRSESGTINVAKSYPNQGALRVYLVPRD